METAEAWNKSKLSKEWERREPAWGKWKASSSTFQPMWKKTGVRGGPYVTPQNQYLFLDLLLIVFFKKVEAPYVVPGTLGSLSVPGEGLFFFSS